MKYAKIFNTRQTSQMQPIPGAGQVQNSAGGYAWAVDDWTSLRRFLVLGTEGGSYYAAEQKLTVENAEAVRRCILADGVRVVREIVEISDTGRAPKNDPALFALAMCAGLGDPVTRRAALEALPKVARIGTHLFHFADYVAGFRGWGRGLRQAIGNWYDRMPTDRLADQVIKYRQRDGWSHRDLLRLAHPKTSDVVRNAIYKWTVDGWDWVGEEPHPDDVLRTLWAFERAQRATTPTEAARLVRDYNLPMEAVPTDKRSREVWEAQLPHAGLTFLFRNLGNLSKAGVLCEGAHETIRYVTGRLTDAQALRRGRIHPIQALSALTIYKQGHGARGDGSWDVVKDVVDALDQAFYLAFGSVQPAGKRWVLALDVSGSMSCGQIAGVPGLTPRVGSAAMAMVTYKVEPTVSVVAFQDRIRPIDISRGKRLDDVVQSISNLPFGATDCAQPMLWALKEKVRADTFVIYTDSETWAGSIHPAQALRDYRQKTGIAARLVVVGMVANKFTIADPNDAGMMDVVGFDTSAPEVIRQFAAGLL
jgi:60 kDa SS-A/Ro ribonucleoprotein